MPFADKVGAAMVVLVALVLVACVVGGFRNDTLRHEVDMLTAEAHLKHGFASGVLRVSEVKTD